MKKFVLTLIFILVATFSLAQGPRMLHQFRDDRNIIVKLLSLKSPRLPS